MRQRLHGPLIAAAVALLAILSTTDGGLIPRVHGGGPCTSDDDCQLNGRCVGGKCRYTPVLPAMSTLGGWYYLPTLDS